MLGYGGYTRGEEYLRSIVINSVPSMITENTVAVLLVQASQCLRACNSLHRVSICGQICNISRTVVSIIKERHQLIMLLCAISCAIS
jgi:hypothetical protein